MSKNLMAASHQWATRPVDQIYPNLREMNEQAVVNYLNSKETTVDLDKSKVIVGANGDLELVTDYGQYNFSYWGFGQYCRNCHSDPSYMRTLKKEPERAAMNINRDISEKKTIGNSILYTRHNRLLSSTSEKYARLPNCIMIQNILDICPAADGWKLLPARPPVGMDENDPRIHPATEDELGLSSRMQVGDPCISAGAYLSDEDCFVFLVNEKLKLNDGKSGLYLGFFARNSEVGKNAFSLTTFLYREVCGNHIVWGAKDVKKSRVKHMGRLIDERVKDTMMTQIQSYLKFDLDIVAERIERAKKLVLGPTTDDVEDLLFANKDLKLSRRVIRGSLDLANKFSDTDGDPRTVWGFVNGLTRFSQGGEYQSDRDELDVVSSRILELAK